MRSLMNIKFDCIGFCYISCRERTVEDIMLGTSFTERPQVLIFNVFTSKIQFIGDMEKMRNSFNPETIICRGIDPQTYELRELIMEAISEEDNRNFSSPCDIFIAEDPPLPGCVKVMGIIEKSGSSVSTVNPCKVNYGEREVCERLRKSDEDEYTLIFNTLAEMGRNPLRADVLYDLLRRNNYSREELSEEPSNIIEIPYDSGTVTVSTVPEEESFLQFTLEELEEIVKYTSYLCNRETRYSALASSACNALSMRR